MSFILDALKKSESERQRQSGPALFEVKVAPPRNRFAIWAIGLGGLLAINLGVVGWMFWRGGSSHAVAQATSGPSAALAATPSVAANPAMPAAARTPEGATAGPQVHAMPATAQAGTAVPAGASALPGTSGAAAPPGTAMLPAGSGTAGTAPAPGGVHAGAGASGSLASAAAPGADRAPAGSSDDVSPDDLAPAVEPRQSPQSDGVIRATESGLPTYQDAEAEPGANIPSLKLDLHVYSPQPDQRFVFLNMMKLHEGDTLPKGVRVERITPDGVILSYQGKQFVLLRQ